MKVTSILTLIAFVGSTCGLNHDVEGLDSERDIKAFTVQTRPSGLTYIDTMKLDAESHMEIQGQQLTSITSTYTESECIVSDLDQGGKAIDTTLTRFTFDTDMAGLGKPVKCDTVDTTSLRSKPECAGFSNMVGTSNHFVVDDEGNIAEASGAGAEFVKNMSSKSPDPLQKVSASKQLEQTSRLLQMVPSYPLKPGDSWDASVQMGEMGDFTGTATLAGYKEFDDHDCAVVTSTGTLRMDMSKALEALGRGDIAQDVSIGDASMRTILYWDDKAKLGRSTKIIVSFVLEINSPLDGSKMSIPVDEVITTTSRIKKE